MERGILTVFCLLIAFQAWGSEANILQGVLPIVKTQQLQEIGSLKIKGLGNVTISARQSDKQLTVQAIGPDGKIIGQAESVTGVRETPVAIITPNGLKTLTIVWERH